MILVPNVIIPLAGGELTREEGAGLELLAAVRPLDRMAPNPHIGGIQLHHKQDG